MISILMPVFNTVPYLKKCLDSICRQTYTNWELIAVDDFSTDGSADILGEYSRKDPRIHVEKNDSKGIISALEKAYKISQGNIIHRMDSDDIMPPNKLKHLYDVLCQHGRGSVATGKVEYFSEEWEVQRGFMDYEAWINHHITKNTIFEDIFTECPIASPAWMMFRDDLRAIGGITDGRYPEDYDLVFRMYVHGLTPYGCDQIIHLWRDWSYRASRTREEYADQQFFDLKMYYFLKYKHLKTKPLIIWGAGQKGKRLYKKFLERGIPVIWVTENANKIGHNIYGTVLLHPDDAPVSNAQVISAVSQPEGKQIIKKRMKAAGKEMNIDLFFFC